jgi:hypothetical protein
MDKPVPVEVKVGQADSASDSAKKDVVVEVAYARPERQTLLTLAVSANSSVEQAIRLSGVLARHPEIDLSVNTVAFGLDQCPCSSVCRPATVSKSIGR